MDQFFAHYGVDWVAIGSSLLAVYMLGNKNRYGFIVFAISNLVWIFLGLVWMNSVGMAAGNFIFLIMNIRGFINWSKEDSESEIIQAEN
ncbi:nicotinamide mononucleotide transporter [Aliikangiella coralliicola]|uniref:Nicotinamide mononucleotide transporter n=1 Tax=Aliikangiella coralliicola TaxID=2592383 RepID=A0A545UFD1_9GAMM|nr:nicotinamide mononucleotide transporter [Aliikangiella coralliicola]TQV88180.1 nicotinamide mononucleotide transporter [Aliikangiella coralliicola]